MINRTSTFIVIFGIVLLYFVYNLIVHILETKNRNSKIVDAKYHLEKHQQELYLAKNELINEIANQYNSDYAEKVAKGSIWIGMPYALLVAAMGKAGETKESSFKDKVIERLYYNGYRTRLNTYKYGLEVIVENYIVVGWKNL